MPIEKRVHGNKVQWRVRIDSGRDESGKRKRVLIGDYPTRNAAKKAMAKAITERDQRTLLLPDTTTMNELFVTWIADEMPKSVAVAQQSSYESLIDKHIVPDQPTRKDRKREVVDEFGDGIGRIKVRNLTVQHVEKILNNRTAAGYSSSQVTKIRMRIAQALDMAVRWNLVARNVARDAKPPKLEYEHGDIWSPDEIRAFLTEAQTDHYWPLWLILAETGSRQSEVLGLAWKHIDLDAGTIRLGEQVVRVNKGKPFVKHGGKTKASQRTLPISEYLQTQLREYRKAWATTKLAAPEGWNPDGLLFVSLSGGPVNPTRLREHHFKPLRDAAGVPEERGMHQLRNAAISTLLAAGVDPGSVAKRAGHASSRMVTDVYQRITTKQQEQMTDILSAVLQADNRQDA